MPTLTRSIASVAALGVSAAVGTVGCGLDLNGKLVESGDADPSGIGASSSGNSSGSGGGNSSGSGGGSTSGGGTRGMTIGSDDAGDDDGGDFATGDASPSNCNFAGTWATKITINVNWVPQGLMGVILAPGSGKIQQWIKSVRTVNGTATTDTASVCGIVLPDFSGTSFVGGETYGVRFPPSLFDNSYLPTFAIFGTLGGNSPTATFATKATASLIGLTLANPATAPWPTPVMTAVDADMDNNPGVTVNAATGPIPGRAGTDGGTYSPFPVDVFSDRANQLFVVIRQVTQLSGAATDCNHVAGTTTIPQITDASGTPKYAIDSHVIGCNLIAGGQCSSSQISFIDGTQPVFSPSGNASFTSVRMKSGTTCSDVRSMLP
jgi:hypothetical protein